MARGMTKAMTGLGVAALLLAGCSAGEGDNAGENGDGSNGSDPVATEMRSWDPCEVLENLQPIVDYMGITEFTATADPTVPDSAGFGEATLDPDALVCGAGIELAEIGPNMSGSGLLRVSIVPLDNEEQATESYASRAPNAVGPVELANEAFGDPWDEGILLATSEESGATDYLDLVARDGQWIIQIEIQYTGDYNAKNGMEPSYPFTNDELYQWFAETYLPAVNQTVNDRAAGGE